MARDNLIDDKDIDTKQDFNMPEEEQAQLDDLIKQLEEKFNSLEENLNQRIGSLNKQIDEIETTVDELIKEFEPTKE